MRPPLHLRDGTKLPFSGATRSAHLTHFPHCTAPLTDRACRLCPFCPLLSTIEFWLALAETVSLWGLNDRVDAITANVTNVLSEIREQVDSQIADELSEIRDFVDAQCAWPYQYRPSGSADCASLTVCGQGTYELTAPTTSTDRQCARWTACPSGAYEELAPSRYQNRVCRTATTCGNGEYQFLLATAKTDTVCNEVSVCASNQWQTTAPTPTSDRACQNHTVCSSAEIVVQEPSGTRDRICAGDTFGSCAERLALGQRLGGAAGQPGQPFVASGLTNITLAGTRHLTYCYNHAATGAWTLVMRVSRHDGSISFHHNGEGWRREQFKTNIIANYDFRQSANTGWGSNDCKNCWGPKQLESCQLASWAASRFPPVRLGLNLLTAC